MDEDSGCVIWDTCPSDKEADWCRFIKILDCFFFQSILVEKSKSQFKKMACLYSEEKEKLLLPSHPFLSYIMSRLCELSDNSILHTFKEVNQRRCEMHDTTMTKSERWQATPAQVAQARWGCQCQTTVTITPRPLNLPSLFGIWLPPTLSNISVEISHPGLFNIYGILWYMLTIVAFHNIAKGSHHILFCKWNHTIQSHPISKSTLYCM